MASPSPCPAIAPPQRAIGLLKLAKRAANLLWGHANARIGDADVHIAILDRGIDCDAPFFGEATGIGEQVKQDLAHACRIDVHERQHVRYIGVQADILAAHKPGGGRHRITDQRRKICLFFHELHAHGVNLRQIKDVIDQPLQVDSIAIDLVGVAA